MGRGGQRSYSPGLQNLVPDFRQGGVAFKYVKRGYHLLCRHALTLALIPVAATVSLEIANMYKTGELGKLWHFAAQTDVQFNMATFMGCILLLTGVAVTYVFTRAKPVYLMNYTVYRPPARMQVSYTEFMKGSRDSEAFTDTSLEFQEKILAVSGLGPKTHLPDGIILKTGIREPPAQPGSIKAEPPEINMDTAREEAEQVMFSCVEQTLKASRIKPSQVDILVVNCSLFNPTPSLSAMIINHFKMRSNIVSYNLGGMGCSAGVIAISLAKELLQVYPGSRALVVSTENITQNWYFGNQRSMLIPNCLFRVGGAAILLSNRRSDYWSAKYELLHVVRTHMGASDEKYNCVFQRPDSEGKVGVHLSKQLMAIAGHALKANITTLGPLVLPISEQLLFFFNLIARKVFKMKVKGYIPDFKLAFEHFCIHTGGRGVIEEIEKQLELTPSHVQPSKDALFRYGNVSSSSVWYVLSNIETLRGVRHGDRVWQIAFGSGFKCNSAVWRAMRRVNTQHPAWTSHDDEPSLQPKEV